jgi:hypothetical protein
MAVAEVAEIMDLARGEEDTSSEGVDRSIAPLRKG